ncbi:WhiB family transcriptional regulator [Streptomyces sp. NPDC006251]|uniref:WhiB family transcriptional regulator n=1 Tax=Streptomyces sp. NPDC006251 TaxID=3155718 RepID=UPI0033A7EC41
MTSTSERPRPAAGQTAEGDIASFLARTESVGALAQDGYLAGHDGRAIAQRLRRPELVQALAFSVCHSARPDTDRFYQDDEEEVADWRRRRAQTIRDHCAVCPVRAACAELALRDEDVYGVRGGLPEEKLAVRLATDAKRLEQARTDDGRAEQLRSERLEAEREVRRLALMHTSLRASQATRDENNAEVRAAVQERDAKKTAHRLAAGWAVAA